VPLVPVHAGLPACATAVPASPYMAAASNAAEVIPGQTSGVIEASAQIVRKLDHDEVMRTWNPPLDDLVPARWRPGESSPVSLVLPRRRMVTWRGPMKRLRERLGSIMFGLFGACVVASTFAARTATAEEHAAPAVGGAKGHLDAAARAAHAQRWDEALAQYKAAQTSSPSLAAATGLAESYDALRQNVEAYNAFREVLTAYGPKLSRKEAAAVAARIAALERVTGALALRVSTAGAMVTVDGAAVGTSPLSAPVRVSTGLHRVRATKPGFEDAEALPTVSGGQSADVDLTLKEMVRTGHVDVRVRAPEKTAGAPVVVIVDGTERGPVPWSGELEAGPHDVYARSARIASPHQTINVIRGQTISLAVELTAIESAMSVATADRLGHISVDGKLVGEGAFEGRLPIGQHVVHITRPGYESLDRTVVLRDGESYSETFTLSPIGHEARETPSRAFEGIIGGVMLAGAFQVNGLNGDFSEPCSFASSPSPASCSAGSPMGGALMGYVGYMASPVGVDVLFGGQLDTTTASFTTSGASPTTESFTVPRMGGFIAPRARISGETSAFRFSFAAGVGLAVRAVSLSSHGVSGLFGSDPSGVYVAPAVTFEGSVHFRASQTVAVGLGLMYWAESAGDGVTLKSGSVLTAPAVVLSAAQATVLPFVGLEFGP